MTMNTTDVLKSPDLHARLVIGDCWMVFNSQSQQWEVYQYIRGKGTRLCIATPDVSQAVKELAGAGV